MTDSDGRYAFADLPPGTYWVWGDDIAPERVTLDERRLVITDLDLTTRRRPPVPPSLQALEPAAKAGRTVLVTLSSGETVEGRLVGATPSSLSILTGDRRRELDERDVWRVEARRPGYLWKAAGSGAAAAAIAVTVFIAGPLAESRVDLDRSRAAGYVAAAGVAGAGLAIRAVKHDRWFFNTRELLFHANRTASGSAWQLSLLASASRSRVTLSRRWE